MWATNSSLRFITDLKNDYDNNTTHNCFVTVSQVYSIDLSDEHHFVNPWISPPPRWMDSHLTISSRASIAPFPSAPLKAPSISSITWRWTIGEPVQKNQPSQSQGWSIWTAPCHKCIQFRHTLRVNKGKDTLQSALHKIKVDMRSMSWPCTNQTIWSILTHYRLHLYCIQNLSFQCCRNTVITCIYLPKLKAIISFKERLSSHVKQWQRCNNCYGKTFKRLPSKLHRSTLSDSWWLCTWL